MTVLALQGGLDGWRIAEYAQLLLHLAAPHSHCGVYRAEVYVRASVDTRHKLVVCSARRALRVVRYRGDAGEKAICAVDVVQDMTSCNWVNAAVCSS